MNVSSTGKFVSPFIEGEETQLLDNTDSFQITLPESDHFDDSLADDLCELPSGQPAPHCDENKVNLDDSLCGDDIDIAGMDDTQLEENKQSHQESSLPEEAATETQDTSSVANLDDSLIDDDDTQLPPEVASMIHSDSNVTLDDEKKITVQEKTKEPPFVSPQSVIEPKSVDGKSDRNPGQLSEESSMDKHSNSVVTVTIGDSVTSDHSTLSSDDVPNQISTVKVRPSFGKKKKQFVAPTSTTLPQKTKSPKLTEECHLPVDTNVEESPTCSSPVMQDSINKENAPSKRTPETSFSAPKKTEALKVKQTDKPQVREGATKNTAKKATGAGGDSNKKEQKKQNNVSVKQAREQKRLEKEKAKLEKERLRKEKCLEQERKKAEREQNKMDKELKKLEKAQKNATKNKKAKVKPQTDTVTDTSTPSGGDGDGTSGNLSAITETVNQENVDTISPQPAERCSSGIESECITSTRNVAPSDETDNTTAGKEDDPELKSGETDTDSKTDDKTAEVKTEPLSSVDVDVHSTPPNTDGIPTQKQAPNTTAAHVSRKTMNQAKKRLLPDNDKQDIGAKKFKPNPKNAKPIKKGGGRKSKHSVTASPVTPSTKGKSTKAVKRKAESPQASEPEPKRSKPANYSGPVWVQCDNVDCQKWRNLKSISDPSVVPDNWTCSMNDELDYNSCSAPEEVLSDLGDSQEFIESPFIPGSLVWAKMDGYPWWPAMVEEDPDDEVYYRLGQADNHVPVKYHVVFLDTPVCRAWVHFYSVQSYDECVDPNEELKVNVPQKYKKSLKESKKRATKALGVSLKERLDRFSFSNRFKKNGGNRKRKCLLDEGDTNYKTSRIDRSKGGKRKSTHLLLDNRDDKENQPSNKERGLVSKSECPSTDLNELDSSEEGDTIMAKSVSLSNVSMTEQLLSEE